MTQPPTDATPQQIDEDQGLTPVPAPCSYPLYYPPKGGIGKTHLASGWVPKHRSKTDRKPRKKRRTKNTAPNRKH